MGKPKRWDKLHKEENQGEQSKLVQGGWESSLGTEEILAKNFKGELASFCRKNKVPSSVGIQLKTLRIQRWKHTAFYVTCTVVDGRV